jgi:hypothetical protein
MNINVALAVYLPGDLADLLLSFIRRHGFPANRDEKFDPQGFVYVRVFLRPDQWQTAPEVAMAIHAFLVGSMGVLDLDPSAGRIELQVMGDENVDL